jgi:TRAP-type C4-dicarboxylate transport system substrate-binding protein
MPFDTRNAVHESLGGAHMRKIAGLTAAVLSSFLFSASHAFAACDEDEIVIKFSHVVAAEGHPKGKWQAR